MFSSKLAVYYLIFLIGSFTLTPLIASTNITFESSNNTEDTHFEFGLALDFSLNETLNESDSPDKLISAPGCPFSEPTWGMISHPMNRNIWVHYGNPPKCFLVGTQGPCPFGYKLAPRRHSSQGICTCGCYFKFLPNPRITNAKLLDEINNPFIENIKPYCFDGYEHRTFYQNKCYTILTQGPCDKSEVLLMDEQANVPTCKQRECSVKEAFLNHLQSRFSFSFKYNNTCQEYGSPCQNPETLQDDHKYFLTVRENSTYPFCNFNNVAVGIGYAYSQGISGEDVQKICEAAGMKYSNYLNTCVTDARRGRNIG